MRKPDIDELDVSLEGKKIWEDERNHDNRFMKCYTETVSWDCIDTATVII